MNSLQWKEYFNTKEFEEQLSYLYVCNNESVGYYKDRLCEVLDGLGSNFAEYDDIRLFSAPGRTEIGGNHTDHQRGCVIAASINLDVIGAVAKNGTDKVRILSKGYKMDVIDINDLDVKTDEYDIVINQLLEGRSKEEKILAVNMLKLMFNYTKGR